MDSKLSPLQHEFLDAFFRRETRFFLTGGAALAGFLLGHRTTNDLDLFATSDVLDDGDRALAETAQELGAEVEKIQTAPGFRRRLVKRAEASIVVDLAVDETPQPTVEKLRFGEVRVDPPDEILVNKLCTLLSRAEIRDLVDLHALENAGYSLLEALRFAAKKDAGLTPAQLAWVLSQIRIGPDAGIPGGGSAASLKSYLDDLQKRLTRIAFPGIDDSA